MLQHIEHIANLGPFKFLNRDPADKCPEFGRLTLVFARNGRGKSTIAHLLRCLGLGNSALAQARRRLGAPVSGTAKFLVNGKPVALETDAWRSQPLKVHVFDEGFVHQNILDGLDNLPMHGRNILPLVIGERGVALVRKSNKLAAEIAELNETRTRLESEIRRHAQGMDPEAFSRARSIPNVDAAIEEARRDLRAQEDATRVASHEAFDAVALRNPSLHAVEPVLGETAKGISAKARAAVQQRLAQLGASGERWLREGMSFGAGEECPFCVRPTRGVEIIDHYGAFFGAAYEEHAASILRVRDALRVAFGVETQRDVHAALVREEARREFWAEFIHSLGALRLDPEGLDSRWTDARNALDAAMDEKARRPLDPIALDETTRDAVGQFVLACNHAAETLSSLAATTLTITALKARTAAGSVATAKARLLAVENSKARHTAPLSSIADEYLSVLSELKKKRAAKEAAKTEIHGHNSKVFSKYEKAINANLERFQVEPRVVALRGEIDTSDAEVPTSRSASMADPSRRESTPSQARVLEPSLVRAIERHSRSRSFWPSSPRTQATRMLAPKAPAIRTHA